MADLANIPILLDHDVFAASYQKNIYNHLKLLVPVSGVDTGGGGEG